MTTEGVGVRATTACDQCGQADDHPKAHLQGIVQDGSGQLAAGIVSKHHDCLSAAEKAMLVASGQAKGAVKASAVIRACEGGLKGPDLVEFIVGEHDPDDLAVGDLR